jgi:hypothetical protein
VSTTRTLIATLRDDAPSLTSRLNDAALLRVIADAAMAVSQRGLAGAHPTHAWDTQVLAEAQDALKRGESA